jgi:hypothetical protein
MADALLTVENAALVSIRQVSDETWAAMSDRMRKSWRRSRSKAHDPLMRLLAQSVADERARWDRIAAQVLTAADEMVWPTLAAEMEMMEKRLGKKYAGIAARGIGLVPGQELLDAAKAEWSEAGDAAVDWMMTRATMALDQAARDKVEAAELLTVHLWPLWSGLAGRAGADMRRVEFEYVNATRTLAAEAVDALTEVVDGTPAA